MPSDIVAGAMNEELDELTGLVLDPADPIPTGRIFLDQNYTLDSHRCLLHQSGVFYRYNRKTNSYVEIEEGSIRAGIYSFLEPAVRWTEPRGKTPARLEPFKPTKAKVDTVLDAIRALCNLPSEMASPCWLEPRDLNAIEIVACRNGLVHLPTRRLLPATSQFFTLTGLDFEFDATATPPENWLRFLWELWPDDAESVRTLQEWIGYLLTHRTQFQKMLLLVGPKRSGKGTIGRVIRMLLGDRNVCGPTLANMGAQFGLATLIGKSAAIIADARISSKTDTAVVAERLLSISGEDTLSIPRKYLPDWNGKLPTRFTLMTNELPRIEDHSGALASRFLVLSLSKSFYGREDHDLFDTFIPETPRIFLWALDGLDRLLERGRFQQPRSADELIQQFEDLGSPIGAFIRECCDVGPGHGVRVDDLFQAWKSWSQNNGREHPGTAQSFARSLRAALPALTTTQPRIDGDRVRYFQGLSIKGGD